MHYLVRHGWALAFIAAGIFSAIHSRFRNPAALIFLLIGLSNIVERFEVVDGVYSDKLIWPLAIISLGLLLIFKRRRPKGACSVKTLENYESVNDNSRLNIDVNFGGRKEIVTSKNFHGGRLSAMFSGLELNLMQADTPSSDPMILDMRVAFAGCEIVVPAHWEIQNEIAPTFGSVEDNRGYRAAGALPVEGGRKLLLLRGSCNFGSIEIKAY